MGVDTMGNMFMPARAPTPMRCRSMSARISTPSRPAASMTACWACWRAGMVRTLNDLGIKTKHPIVVTNWTNEEGTRFAPAMLASGVFAGVHEQDWAYDRVDAKGKRFGDELERIGWKGDEEVGARKMHACSSCTSSRARSSRPRARTSVSSPTARACAGSSARSPARKATPARPRCRCAERRPRPGPDHRAGARDRHGQCPQRGGRHRPYRRLSEFAQHHPRQGGLHHRFPQP
jgi:hypothetical protein